MVFLVNLDTTQCVRVCPSLPQSAVVRPSPPWTGVSPFSEPPQVSLGALHVVKLLSQSRKSTYANRADFQCACGTLRCVPQKVVKSVLAKAVVIIQVCNTMASKMQTDTPLGIYLSLLRTNSGRDKILRTLGYASVFVSGAFKGKINKDLQTLALHFGATRTVLRLFDDLPTLLATLASFKSKVGVFILYNTKRYFAIKYKYYES